MIREAMEDTVLRVPNPPGVDGERLVPLPKGAQVTTDVVGIRKCHSCSALTTYIQHSTFIYHAYSICHGAEYNPRYFPDPYEFKPSRWYNAEGVVESEAYTAFSIGECVRLIATLSL